MTDAYLTRGALHSDLDTLAPMLSLAFAEPALAIFPRGHTADSIAYRRAELEQWFQQCETELGVDEAGRPNAGTTAGQRRLMVVCPREGPGRDVPIGFCQYEMVEPGMKHAESSADANLPPMPPFPEGGDKEQYYLWKDMIWHTRRVVLGHCRHASEYRRRCGAGAPRAYLYSRALRRCSHELHPSPLRPPPAARRPPAPAQT